MSTESGSAALDAGDRVFHDAYRGARDGVRAQVPILVVLPNELALHYRGERQLAPYSCPSFTAAKAAAHIAVALFALTGAQADPLHRNSGVARLLESIAAALDNELESDAKPLLVDIAALLTDCRRFAQAVCLERLTGELRAAFASDVGPQILHITELATFEQIAGLHQAAEVTLRTLSPADQGALEVVVVGDHQARTRSLGMQYFKRRFDEQPGADRRVTYGENIADEEEAISLVATRRLDKEIAQAFFADDTRLQRDVLGDAAQRCLDQMGFPAAVSR